jgi:hypothetical protein
MYNKEAVRKRMSELMEPVERQIMMTDNREELLMMACAMMQRTTEIFESELGVEGRKQMYKDMV